ncbi:GlxA family transcriptional regulator [Sneathiella limimaris]|uniref:GlxA family transcriptional regulator n=1 Tax=Sneathiella limimaris TaxID=1964213 RepID=UPI00146D0F07|nr:helix-turn-helix domain-containing protein [Sneathiella limimaris]
MANPLSVLIMATPETSASSVSGLYETLKAAGQDWEMLVSGEPAAPLFDLKLVGPSTEPFSCGSGMMIAPDVTFETAAQSDLIIVPGLNLSPYERIDPKDHPGLAWLKSKSQTNTRVVSACSGAVYLAEIGLLDGLEATTHWAFENLFKKFYPKVRLRLDLGLCFRSAEQGVVTSGGSTGWQELALFLISNYGSLQQSSRAAKIWLMADRGELQAPYHSMIRTAPHDDQIIENAQIWIADHYAVDNPVAEMVENAKLPATTFARRFRKATGRSPMEYIQSVRIEEARQLLETTDLSITDIGEQVGYMDTPSFRRLFKRKTGLTPAEHRRMFGTSRFARYR